jgi:GTP diphosphokinase / guanosine-3',5'-bis(diphosphate) 3'-diphosphatase
MQTKELEKELLKYSPNKFQNTIKEGIKLAYKYYKGQERLSGEGYINHAFGTAITIARMGLDTDTILAAILHNSITQNPTLKSEIEKEIKEVLGGDVLNLIHLCDEISRATSSIDTDYDIVTRYILNKTEDIRAVILKLADSLDNVRTIEYMPSERKGSKIRKIFEVYGPLAEYLNLDDIKKELEERALEIYRPEIFEMIKEKLEFNGYTLEKKMEYENFLIDITSKTIPNPIIKGRIKSIYSIYNKQHKYLKEGQNIDLSNIQDILAFRLITDTTDNCFKILETLMDNGDILTEDFDDYITYPKKNGYSALQGPVIFKDISNNPIEIQILTYEMYYHNTYGPASHIAYKESKSRNAKPTDKYNWVEQVHKEISRNISLREEKISIPINVKIFSEKTFAFTPKRKIVQLDQGDTPVDFAYKVHTDIGNSMVSAKVNGLPSKLYYKIVSGDTVEIVTQAGKKSAKEEWIKYANSPNTQTKIQRSWKKR